MRSISSRAESGDCHALMSSFAAGRAQVTVQQDGEQQNRSAFRGRQRLRWTGCGSGCRSERLRESRLSPVRPSCCVSWMEVCRSAMGPERILPSSEDELGEDERPADGAGLPAGAVWVGGEDMGDMELDGEEEEEEEEGGNGGYYYQPLNQDPEGLNSSEQPEDEDRGDMSHSEQLQQVERRIEVMGLHLPEAPPPHSDEEEDPEAAAAQRSRASIPMDAGELTP
ncbi:male-enhanced antigen 1 [Cyprinodon tularosa]|uniref:male-enhanced antigen 1 n=1 Tax=Cyprinodon tularosa TaxID=77115 RepID=UPI0018E224C8|nr:male-enhanced antigen 1 [Cyprinodon tularosa]